MLEIQSIQSLLRLIAQKDDKQAFSLFFDHYYTRLIRFAKIYVPNHHHAEDIVSEVLIKLLRKRKELFEMSNFEAYLFFAVKNQSLNFLKSQKAKQKSILIDDESDHMTNDFVDPFCQLVEQELGILVTNAVEMLPPKRKLVYQFIIEEKMKIHEVAELFEISDKTVQAHLRLAVGAIRRVVHHYFSDEKSNATFMKVAK